MRLLRELQREWGKALLAPGESDMPSGFGIYVGNVYGNWTKALASAYPIMRKIVGQPYFEGLARAYARAHPSASADLSEFGSRFAEFVGGFPDTQDLPYLADVARMEWLVHRAYFAAAAPRFDSSRLANVLPEKQGSIRLGRAPASALMASEWPLARIWEVHQDGYRGDLEVDFQAGFERVLVSRPRWRVNVEAVAPGDYRFLAEAGRGAALGNALQAASDADPRFDAARALARWVEKGVISL